MFKKFVICILIIKTCSICFASDATEQLDNLFSYHLDINSDKYSLKMKLKFLNGVSLKQVRNNFKNQWIWTSINSSIKSVLRQPINHENYQQKMIVSTFGFSSELISDCDEFYKKYKNHHVVEQWSRTCKLRTDIGDAGKTTEWKADSITCENRELTRVSCDILIEGKIKPFKFLNLTIFSSENFSLRLKHPVLYNFAKIWYYTNQASVSLKQAISDFEQSELKQNFDRTLNEGLDKLGKQTYFSTDFNFEDK